MKLIAHSRHRNTQQGFTLIELMVTVAVFGVVAAVAVPSFSKQLTRHTVNNEIDKLRICLQESRIKALTVRREVAFSIDTSAQTMVCDGTTTGFSDKVSISLVNSMPTNIRFSPNKLVLSGTTGNTPLTNNRGFKVASESSSIPSVTLIIDGRGNIQIS